MLTPARTARRGVTLIEMLVAMVVAGLVMTLLTLAGLRQQRLLSDLLDDSAMSDRLREASALLPIALRSLGASAGDVRDARDTALEVRATIGGGIVCDTARGALVLPAATADAGTYASYSTSVQPGDTAWLLDPGDAARTWVPHAVTSVSAAPAGQCGPRGPRLSPDGAARPRTAGKHD
jgi:prepilin-type N-terminal cleavage/methylation domain-containing protein